MIQTPTSITHSSSRHLTATLGLIHQLGLRVTSSMTQTALSGDQTGLTRDGVQWSRTSQMMWLLTGSLLSTKLRQRRTLTASPFRILVGYAPVPMAS